MNTEQSLLESGILADLPTQSLLGVLFLDRLRRAPIARMPVYAEASVAMDEAPPEIAPDQVSGGNDLFLHRTLGPILRQALAAGLDDGGFGALGQQEREDLLAAVETALRERRPDIMELPPEDMRRAADEAVREALERLGLRGRTTPLRRRMWSFPLGFLATDHLGYASYDLTRLRDFPAGMRQAGGNVSVELNVYPMGIEGNRLEALEQHRTTPQSVFAKFEIDRPDFDPDIRILKMPSMQNPSLSDWYLSPGSFTTQPDALVGSDGCEALVPSQLSLHEFRLSQVVRLRDTPVGITLPTGARFGYIDEYRVSWHALGHSLGEIKYSLPLAPGESVKLAMIDWSWDSATSRTEDTTVTESLLHQTHRDRVITETMKASLSELQHGTTTTGGAALSAGGSASAGAYGGAIGASGAIGSTYSSTSGSRQLAAENVQKLSDTFAQHSTSVRELTSTVVVQAQEAQREAIETRTFTNYNHSHTLTILYYEILRHFRVATEWTRRRPVVLMKPLNVSFEDDKVEATVMAEQRTLRNALLDPSLAPAFDALEKLQVSRENYRLHGIKAGAVAKPWGEGDLEFTLFEFLIKTSDGLRDKTSNKVVAVVRKFDGTAVWLDYLYEGPHVPPDKLEPNLNSGKVFDETSWVSQFVKPRIPLKWREIAGFEIEKWGDDEWRIDKLGITAFNQNLYIPLVPFDSDVDMYFRDSEPSSATISFIKRPEPDPPWPAAVPTADEVLSAEESRLVARLKAHLKAESAHYFRALGLARDPSAIARDFDGTPWNASSSILDHAEPLPLDTFGDYVAYPLVDPVDPALDPDAPPAEKLITFPVRGVFAEGKLGHCNVSEEIDETRFWRWEEHTIPVEAPEIAATTPITPAPVATEVTPTAMPASLVNIVNPTPAPDPAGMSAALAAITTANAFRDMSGRAEITDLLKKLSDNSVAIAQASKFGGGGGAPNSGGGSSSSGTPTSGTGVTPSQPGGSKQAPPSTPQSVAEVNDLASGIRRQLPPAQANPLVGKLYQNVVDGTGPDSGGSIGTSALAQLTQQKYARRIATSQTEIRAFTPTSENTIVAWAAEEQPPAGLTVVNWAHDGVAHYGHMRNGKMIGDSSHPIRSPQDITQVVLHETAGWAQIGAGAGLSVQFTVGPDGTAFQHNDIAEECAHASALNPRSIGIEFTNWGPFYVGQTGAAPLATSAVQAPTTDLQTNAVVGPNVTDNRERLPILWLNGNKGNGTTGDYYVFPPAAQLEAVSLLLGWLTGGPLAAAIDAPALWRQLQNHPDPAKRTRSDPYLFEMSQDPAWTKSSAGWTGTAPTGLGGIFAHRQFSQHQDGAVQGLYTWLRLNRQMPAVDAYTRLQAIIIDDALQVSAPVKFGGKTFTVHYIDVSSVLDVVI